MGRATTPTMYSMLLSLGLTPSWSWLRAMYSALLIHWRQSLPWVRPRMNPRVPLRQPDGVGTAVIVVAIRGLRQRQSLRASLAPS